MYFKLTMGLICFCRVFFISDDILQGNSLDEVGLMAYTDNEQPLMLNVLLGSLQVLSSDDVTLHPAPVSNISCDDVTINNLSTHSDMPSNDDAEDKCLSMTLRWCQPEITADVTSYHIWFVTTGNTMLSQ